MTHTCGGWPGQPCLACGADRGPRNARFWAWINGGWVKLTLKPGQVMETYHCAPHEEGWSSERERWEHAGDCVRRQWLWAGRDCDGRHESYGEDYCALEFLRSETIDTPEAAGLLVPDWQGRTRRQYDQYAEMAGY